MKLDRKSLLLYAVTDRQWLGCESLASQVETAIKAGVTMIQLREKDIVFDEFLSLAKEVKEVADKCKVPLIINDDVDVALMSGADGVHVGQHDMQACDVRNRIGYGKILGVSAQTVEQAILAEEMGADYIGVGAVFPTSTKFDANTVSNLTLKKICEAVSIPVVAIGGISKGNVLSLVGSGISGIAVVSAIFAQNDIYSSTRELRLLTYKMVECRIN